MSQAFIESSTILNNWSYNQGSWEKMYVNFYNPYFFIKSYVWKLDRNVLLRQVVKHTTLLRNNDGSINKKVNSMHLIMSRVYCLSCNVITWLWVCQTIRMWDSSWVSIWLSNDPDLKAPDEVRVFITRMPIAPLNPMFDHLLESSHRDDSNK